LVQLAHRYQLGQVEAAVLSHQGVEKERQDVRVREVVAEVKPVLEVSCLLTKGCYS
jgi:vancomycin permeability regulator SanA